MPNKSKNAREETADSALANTIETTIGQLAVTTTPVMVIGVNRRVNTGSYEHIDLYAGIALPMVGSDLSDPEALTRAVKDAAEIGFRETSRETYDRYRLIKQTAEPRQEEESK